MASSPRKRQCNSPSCRIDPISSGSSVPPWLLHSTCQCSSEMVDETLLVYRRFVSYLARSDKGRLGRAARILRGGFPWDQVEKAMKDDSNGE